ncbi:hypothetical protein CsSME_00005645 [Camellia sinensis var. sinensis]
MSNNFLSMAILFLTFFIFSSYFQKANGNTSVSVSENTRETLEIIIGGGFYPPYFSPPPESECPPPSPPPVECPPPPSPPPPSPPPPSPPPPSPPPPSSPPPSPPPPSPPPPSPPPPPPVKSPPPPPPPPPRPPPPPPPRKPRTLSRLERAYIVIQRFKTTITSDPNGIIKTWNGKNVCKYRGFRCDKFPTDNTLTVSGVNLNGGNLNGNPLTPVGFLDQLPDLAYFHVNSNNFTGSKIDKISKFRFFFELDFSNNKLTGPFPNSVLGASQLTFLDLRFNSIIGSVNPRVFNLNLDALFLNNNQFTGEIPDNLGNTSALYLTLANNQFTGPIPKSIGQAKINLLEVLLLNNKLSGCLPYEIGLLKIATVFDASMNQLTGPIPRSFGCLEEMQLLNLSFNKLYGTVPEELCQLDDLSNLTLSFNYFTQVGPDCRELIKRNVLDVRMNCILDLPFQKSKAECAAFFSINRSCPDEKSMNYLPCNIEDFASRKASSDGEILMPPVPAPSPSYAALERYRKMDLP